MVDITFRPQKVLDVRNIDIDKLKFPMLLSKKIDGVYCAAIRKDNVLTIYSRTAKPYSSLKHLTGQLWRLMDSTQNDVIIFEAGSELPMDFSTLSGAVRSTKKQATFITGFVHDGLTLKEFTEGGGRNYAERYHFLKEATRFLRFDNLVLLVNALMPTYAVAKVFADALIAKGEEGVVLRDPFAKYHPGKRDITMVKIKQIVSYDLKVLALEEGKGKYKGMVGNLVCGWKNGKTIKVGSGLSDEQRKRWWSGFFYDEIVGKVVQIDAMSESSKGLLRQPIFKGVRFDKKDADV
jgi:ATP-dependent DNA ligase